MLALTVVLLSISGDVSEGRSARLVDDAPLERTSVPQLQADLAALKRMRVSLGGPVAMFSIGLGLSLFGGMFIVLDTVLIGGFSILSPILVMGFIGAGLGVPLVVLGAWMLWQRIDDRARIEALSQELRRQINEQQRGYRSEVPLRVPSVTLARF